METMAGSTHQTLTYLKLPYTQASEKAGEEPMRSFFVSLSVWLGMLSLVLGLTEIWDFERSILVGLAGLYVTTLNQEIFTRGEE